MGKKDNRDNVEYFIRKNRDMFFDESPSDEVWKKIEVRLHKEKKGGLSILWNNNFARISAVFLILIGSGVVFYNHYFSENSTSVQDTKQVDYSLEEFQEAEDFYIQLISEKKTELYSYKTDSVFMEKGFLKDMYELDNLYLELKKSIHPQNYNEKMIDAAIMNLQLRIHILNKQIALLKKIKQKRNQQVISL
ncbi:MAG: hypothetical protein QM536_00010 [Chitinophagaceae bacterium]|nr:hypothetical protein [Chitinophagaceae bacterium]